MRTDQWALVFVFGYIVLLIGFVAGVFAWKTKRHGGRAPMAFKLLRSPGEALRRRMAAFDENFILQLGVAALGPLGAAIASLWVVARLLPVRPATTWIALGVAAVVFVGGFVVALRWALRDFARYCNDRLGYLGERDVAEHLEPLLSCGYRIFHNVPGGDEKISFILDHVSVGPTGVALIETRTRRKGHTRPALKDHVVTYDGRQLVWPWGEEGQDVLQAVSEADWLKKFIHKRTGINTAVKSVVALPGWTVESTALGDVVVTDSKSVAHAVHGRGPRVLTDEQIDFLTRLLDERCRDVEE